MSTVDQQPVLRRCAACRKESPVNSMKTCMHNQMHYYVCDCKCMHDFYNPPQKAAQPAGGEQHPDDVAVDLFAAVMKAKLAKSREKGRHGWQNSSAAHLGGLLYEHMYKGDPVDVANLAMMLHQNGQGIELPHDARRIPVSGEQKAQDVAGLVEALEEIAGGRSNKSDPYIARQALAAHRAQQEEQS